MSAETRLPYAYSSLIKIDNLFTTLGAAGLLATLTMGPAWGQTRANANRAALPDFDLRDSMVIGEAPRNPQSKALVDRRTSALQAFVAERQAAQPGIRIVPNRHGMPKLMLREGKALSAASTRDPDEIARTFLLANAAVFPFAQADVDQLRLVVRDVTPEATNLVFNQTLNGIDVFQGQIKFTLGKTGEVIQVASGEVVPGITASSTPRLQPADAELAARTSARAQTKGRFVRAPELVIFVLDASTARLAYRLYLEVDAAQLYEILIDAEDGKLLFRHNTYVRAAQARVWTQSPSQGARELVTFPGGWLPAAATVTTGNNVDAFIDADGNDLPDPANTGDVVGGRPSSATQLFDFAYGDGTLGLNPRSFKAASATNLFYFVNIAHDFYYSLGFTEAAGNFQTDNLGNGGLGGDAVIAEAQNPDALDNAGFAPTPEGTPPHMRMGLFTRSTASTADDLDSDYDGQTVVHEYGHGVSNRLVGGGTNTSCLDQIQSGAMGEGWSDYFAISYFNNPVLGAYVTQDMNHGFRRQSYEGYTFTYEDLGNEGYEVHKDGEIWAAALWDLRKSLGQTITDRLVVNGLKATPCNPSMTDARDAILTADLASNAGVNRAAIWTIFAKHGLGYSARGTDGFTGTGTLYDAAYDLPLDLQSTPNPIITSLPLSVHLGAGELYAYTVKATNPNAGTLSFALTSGPAGMTVSPGGAVTWIASFTGQRIKITVTDGKGGKVIHGYLAPVFTHLSTDRPVLISGARDSTGYAWIDVPPGVPVLQVTLRGGTGDADLSVMNPDGDPDFSFEDGNSETLSFGHPKPGRWQVEALGFDAYSGVSLTASLITPPPLSANAVLTSLSGPAGSETFYRVTVPAGTATLQISTQLGIGDVDLYLKYANPAVCQDTLLVTEACDYDYNSENIGNTESITVVNPSAGDWYIDLSGFEDFSGVSLTTSTSVTPPKPDLTISKSHTGNFSPGQTGATYTITVTNAGGAATTGPVSVADSLPAGLAGTAIAGTGWNCLLPTLTCARSDALGASASYPPITVTVNVAANAPASLTNTATVSGGGETNTANNAAQDVTAIGTGPVITLVANAFGESPIIAPNTWAIVKGLNLAPSGDIRVWLGSDFINGQMPAQLDGVSVKVNGKSAYLFYISPTQINILIPPDALSGPIQVQLTNNGVVSNVLTVQSQAQSLSFFEVPSAGGQHYVVGRHLDGGLIGPDSLYPGLSTPVKPGEDIYIVANGFGPTDVPVISGLPAQFGNLPAPFPVVMVGGTPATVTFAGLVGVGLYQINFKVPADAADGDLPLTATYNGLSIQPNLLITVHH
jgi:uncharacterized protein (TIGR03437 family)